MDERSEKAQDADRVGRPRAQAGPVGSVAMLLHKSVVYDSRVRREASALAAAGYDVTVVELAPEGEPLDGFCRWSVLPPGWGASSAAIPELPRRRSSWPSSSQSCDYGPTWHTPTTRPCWFPAWSVRA